MQAASPWLTRTGFTRAKNARHTITMEFFMGVRIAMLGRTGPSAFACRRAGVGPLGTRAAYDQLSHEVSVTIAGRLGPVRRNGFFLTACAYTAPSSPTSCLPDGVHGHRGPRSPTGALASVEIRRVCGVSVFVGAVIYPIYANWTWAAAGSPCLGKNLGLGHGHVDFAGSSVVHMSEAE